MDVLQSGVLLQVGHTINVTCREQSRSRCRQRHHLGISRVTGGDADYLRDNTNADYQAGGTIGFLQLPSTVCTNLGQGTLDIWVQT